jgi:hypothetical protein
MWSLQLMAPAPEAFQSAICKRIESDLAVSAVAFNQLLLRHRACVAGSFCIAPAAEYLGAAAAASKSSAHDVDVWAPDDQASALVQALVGLFDKADGDKVTLSDGIKTGGSRAVLHEGFLNWTQGYKRLREDVSGIWNIRSPHDPHPDARYAGERIRVVQARRKHVQVMACKDFARALATFDINVAAVAWTGRDVQLWAADAFEGIRSMTMRLNPLAMQRQDREELQRTIQRVRKYQAKGFELVDSPEMSAIIRETEAMSEKLARLGFKAHLEFFHPETNAFIRKQRQYRQ